MTDIVQWTASLTAVLAASLIAAHISQKITGIAFAIFTVSSLLWVWFGAVERDHGLLVQNAALTAINLLGIYRYLIRGKPV